MAVKYFCRNTKCDKFNEEIHFPSISYVLREGKLKPKEPLLCHSCGEEVEGVEVKNDGPINVNFVKFNSLSNDEKKRWIMERNKKVQKQDVDLARYYENKQLGINLE